jgi:hypothetical protein
MRKKSRKKPASKTQKVFSHILIRYSIAVVGLACLIFFANFTFSALRNAHVLGTQTFLAKDGDGGQPEEKNGGDDSVGSNVFEGSEVTGDKESGENDTINHPSSPPEATVPCKSPEGKVTETSPMTCDRLRKIWNHETTFSREKRPLPPPGRQLKGKGDDASMSGRIIAHPEMQQRHSGEHENGWEVTKGENDTFIVREGSVEAKTKFPLFLNPSTKQLTVKTSQGEKVVAVLPDEAIANLLAHKVITQLDGQANNASSSVTLTEKGNKPVFEIPGFSEQHLLGFIPVKIHKSIDVSAQTGEVVSENETIGQQILDFFSF